MCVCMCVCVRKLKNFTTIMQRGRQGYICFTVFILYFIVAVVFKPYCWKFIKFPVMSTLQADSNLELLVETEVWTAVGPASALCAVTTVFIGRPL